jgi:tetratricopeptide (TPR) repeat protein
MDILGQYGVLQRDMQRFDESVETLETALKTCRECTQAGLTDPTVAYLSFQLAASYQAAGRLADAEAIYRDIYTQKVIDFDKSGFKEVMERYEAVLIEQNKYEELDRVFSELLPQVTEKLGAADKLSIYCLTVLAKAKHGLRDVSSCTELLKKGIAIMEGDSNSGFYAFDIAQLRSNLAAVLHAARDYAEAEVYYKGCQDAFMTIISEGLKDLPAPSVKVRRNVTCNMKVNCSCDFIIFL